MFTSSLGSFDSGLGATLELGGPDSLVEQQFYAPLVLIDGEIWELPAADALSIPGQVTNIFLTDDVTIYVDVAGDDESGDGTSFNPYQTILRAAEDYVNFVPGDFSITINIGEGVHIVAEQFDFIYPYGNSLRWEGQWETVNTPTISNIDVAATTGSAPYTELEFIDFDLDLSAATSGVEVGHFVRLFDCTGGTNPSALNGVVEIVAEAAGVATCRLWRAVGTTELPSGAITVASVILIKTVLHFTANADGIRVFGPTFLGDWAGIVLRGNDTAAGASKTAILLVNGAGIGSSAVSSSGGLYIYEWATGVFASSMANVRLLRCGIAKCVVHGANISFHATARFSEATFHGIDGSTLFAEGNSSIYAVSCKIHSVETVSSGVPVLCQTGAFIDVSSGQIEFDQGAGTAIFARDLGRVHATGTTITGFATDYNIATGTTATDGAFINIV